MGDGSRRLLAAGALAVVVAGAGGFVAGKSSAERADWHTGTGRVIGAPGEPGLVVTIDGWTYATSGDVDWIGPDGTHHSGDTWPECLKQAPLESPGFGARQTVKFATVKIEAGGTGWRPIVMIDCRI